MRRAANPNIEIMELAVARLDVLAEEMVFLGGCATGLLITDPLAPPIRATTGVDVICEAASVIDYQRLSKRLRAQGFREDQSPGAPICRWRTEGIVLDGRPEVVEEIRLCALTLREHLQGHLADLLTEARFLEALPRVTCQVTMSVRREYPLLSNAFKR